MSDVKRQTYAGQETKSLGNHMRGLRKRADCEQGLERSAAIGQSCEVQGGNQVTTRGPLGRFTIARMLFALHERDRLASWAMT